MAQHDMVLDNNPGLAFRQDLNNALAALVSASLGNTAPTTTYAGQEWIDTGTTIDTDGPWLRQRDSTNTAWIRVRKVDTDQILLKVQQDQIAVTTSGTSPAFTISTKLTNSVAVAANQRFRVKFHASGTTGSNTLARDGLTPYSLKQYDSTGTKISAVIVANMLTDVEYDGTDYVVLDPLPTSSAAVSNLLINGAFNIDQRNAGAAQTITAGAALAYTVDRWWAACTGANVTGQRVAGTTPNKYNYQFTGASSVTGIQFGQRIEAMNSQHAAGQTVSLGIDLANSLLTSVGYSLYYANSDDTFGTLASPNKTLIASGTFTVNSTLTRYSVNVSIPSAASKGLELVLNVGAQTSGTWTIGRVQLGVGSNVSNFEYLPVTKILQDCQRRFFKTFDQSVAPAQNTGNRNGCVTTTWVVNGGFRVNLIYPVEMAYPPTLITYNPNAASNTWRAVNSGANYGTSMSIAVGTRQADIAADSASGAEVYMIHITADAEMKS